MAEPIFDSIVKSVGAVAASLTPSTLPTGYVDGDLIVFWVGQDGGSGTLSIATAGWSIHGTRTGTPAGGAFGSWFSTVVSGGTFNTPTFDSTVSDDYAYIGFIVRGAPSSSYVDVVGTQTDWNKVGNAAAGTPTTGTDGCLVLHGWVADGSVQFRPDITDANLIAQVTDSGKSVAVTYRQQETAGPVDAMQMYFNKATEGGTQFTLCIKNDTGAKLAPDVRVTGDLVSWYGDFSAASAALTWKGLEETGNKFAGGFTSGLLDGITVTTGAVTTATTSGAGNNPVGFDTAITTSTTNNRIDGAWHAYSANLDGRIFSVEVATSRPGTVSGGRIGALGLLVGFSDGTNYEIFRVKNLVKGWAPGTAYRVFVGCGTTTPTYSRGTLDWANITQVAYMLHHINTTADTLSVRNGVLLDRMTLTGGSAASPISSRDLFVATSQNYLGDLIGIRGKSQVQPTTKFQIGDGTNTTHFANSATSTEFPQEWADAFTPNWQDGWHVGDSSVEIRIKPKSTDSIDLSAAIFATDTLQGFVYDSGGSSSADLAHVGCSVVGFSPVELLAGTTITGKTYSGCGTVQTHGANLTNVTVADTLSTNAVVSVDVSGSVLDGCPIDGTGAAYALELDTGVTAITLTDCTITAGSTAKTHVLATTGTVTITIGGSTVSPTYVSAGATVVISAPVVTADISITGMSNTVGANNRLQIINTTAISAADWTANTPYTAGDVVLRTSGIGSENTAGLYFRATTGGNSHVTTEPTWNTTVGGTTADGTVVWTTYAILYYDADPAATSLTDTYIDGEEFKAGEVIEIRFAEEDPAVSFKTYSTSVIAATTGFSALVIEDDDSSYATYSTSGVTQDSIFSPDYVNNYVVLDTDTNFTASGAYAYYCYLLTTSEGMYRFWGGLTGIDPGNIRNNSSVVSLYFDCSSGFVRQTDDIRIFRSDGLRPALDPVTADGGGIEINWKVPVNVVSTGGSALTPTESAQLMALPSASTTATAVGARTVEGTFSEDEILKLLAAALAGQRQGIGTATETYTGLDGTTPRISLTPDANGNGTPVLDVT